jgi:hypothetical protein
MAEQLFSLGGSVAIAGWIALTLSLFVRPMRVWTWRATGAVIPGLLAVAYVVLLVTNTDSNPEGGFGSLEAVRALFSDDNALAAGWIHYLAFDLFVGTWIVRAGLASGVHPLLLLPSLPLTFMLGPAGLLLALIVLVSVGDRSWARAA